MKEFIIELRALLKKHNAVIFFDTENKLSFETTMRTGTELCSTFEYVIDSNDLDYIYNENNES